MKILFARLFVLFALIGVAQAAPLSRDLGQGLTYFRVHQLPSDLPTADATHRQACILDLRYVDGSTEEGTALSAWLKFNATAHAPVFILANAQTGAALVSVLTPRGPGASVVVLGAASAAFTPDIALKVSAETERSAYDALEHGATAESLIAENLDKPRNDEAKLAKERKGESVAVEEDPTADLADLVAKPKLPPPLIDATLQRAVQLHRALLALKKI